MKKLLVLIGIVLLTISAYGQAPKCNTNPYNSITSPCADFQFYNYGTQPYGFILNGVKYIMSYDTLVNKNMFDGSGQFNEEFMKEVGNRPIFIFQYDGKNWIKASEPLAYDYCYYSDGYYYKKYYWTGEGAYKTGEPSGLRVKILNNNSVEIFIVFQNQFPRSQRLELTYDTIIVKLYDKNSSIY